MLIEAELAIADGNKETATKKVQEAKKWIDEKGMYRWDTEVERLRLMLDTRYLVLEQGRG
jgi:hypothetical protein